MRNRHLVTFIGNRWSLLHPGADATGLTKIMLAFLVTLLFLRASVFPNSATPPELCATLQVHDPRTSVDSAEIRWPLLSVRNFRVDQQGEERQRLLPAGVAELDRDGRGNAGLLDVQFGSAQHFFQGDGDLHFAR